MRVFIRLFAFAAVVLGLAACNVLEGQYFQEGVGNNLYSPDLPRVTEYQNAYLDYLCQQSSPVVSPGGDARCSGELPPTAWPLIVQAGMNDIDQRCDGFLVWLDQKKRGTAAAITEISAIRTAADFIINANPSIGPRSLAAVAAAFSLATDTFSNLNSLLLQVDHTTVQTVVFKNREGYRVAARGSVIRNRPDAIHVLRQYLNICMPITIAANINITVTGVQQGIVSPPFLVDPSMVGVQLAGPLIKSIPPEGPRGPLPGAGKNPSAAPIEPKMAGSTETEKNIPQSVGEVIQSNLCIMSPTTSFDSARDAIQQGKIGANQTRTRLFTNTENRIMNAAEVQLLLNATLPPCAFNPSEVGPQTAYEKFRFPDDAAVTSLQQILKVCDPRLTISGRFDAATRDAIDVAKAKINQARRTGLTDLNVKTLRSNSFAAIQATCR